MTHRPHQLLTQLLLRHAGLAQCAAGRAAVLAQQSQQDMLAADVTVAQLQRRLLCQPQHVFRTRGKLLFCHILHTPERIFSCRSGF